MITFLHTCSKDREIATLQQKGEDDANEIAALQRRIRDLEAKIEELEEDLQNEKKFRTRVSLCMKTCVCVGGEGVTGALVL